MKKYTLRIIIQSITQWLEPSIEFKGVVHLSSQNFVICNFRIY